MMVPVTADVSVRFAPKPARVDNAELGRDDLDTDFYVDDQVDLDRIIETETTLALPMKPLCDPGCRGICLVCGANRNVTPPGYCELAWISLKAISTTSSGLT